MPGAGGRRIRLVRVSLPGRGLRLDRGQPQGLPDRPLHLVLVLGGVDLHDVLLAREDGQHRVGLLVVVAQPDHERFLGVVLAGHQRAAAHVALALFPGALDQVVVHAAARAQAAGQDAAADLGVGQVEVDDRVDVVALEEELRLAGVAGKPVDDEPVVPVVLGQPLRGHLLGQIVADELTGG